nr:hypothetical protein [uncultured Flavobacterium sp.]
MKNKLLLLALLFPTLFFAQVGIGTTTPDASAKLEVSATDKGFLQPRVALNSTNNAENTISNPATGLMVYNTATAGSGDTAVTPGVYYNNGTTWQRVANQTEVAAATTATTTIVEGNLGGQNYGGGLAIAPFFGSIKSFGASITLPPGKWEVILNLYFNIIQTFGGGIQVTGVETAYWLTDDMGGTPVTYSYPVTPTDITADVLFPGGGLFTQTAGIGGIGTVHKGSFFIHNTTADPKTYYLFFHEGADTDLEYNDGPEPMYKNLGGTSWKGNRFYAVKIN